jgi:RNA polymerase sigma-70 factor (ECF subfamily)
MAVQPPPDFAVWYEAEYPRLYATVILLCRDRSIAEDITAEAFARAMERWSRVSAMESPGGWTCRVAINLVRRHHRRRRWTGRRAIGTDDEVSVAAMDTRSRIDATSDIALDLVAAIAQLPVRSRTAFVLRYVQDLSEAEAAAAMRIERGTVSALAHQAKTQLRAALAAHAPVRGGTG